MACGRVLLLCLMLFGLIEPVSASSTRGEWVNRLKNLGMALQNHEESMKKLPQDISLGKPLLSWRVALLPFVEEDHLYRQFKLAEPWDSPSNKQLLETKHLLDRGRNFYASHFFSSDGQKLAGVVMPRGPGTFWGAGEQRTLKSLKGDPSRTILLIEVDEKHAPIWTEPRDLIVDPANPRQGIGWHWRQGLVSERTCFALFADGRIRNISAAIDNERLRSLFAGESTDSLTLNWREAISQTSAGRIIVPGLAIGLATILASMLIVYRLRQGRTSPGEWLLLALGAKYLVLLFFFLIQYEFELVFERAPKQHAATFMFLPGFAGCAVCYLAAIHCQGSLGWRVFFIGLTVLFFLGALEGLGSDRYRLPEGALVVMSAPFITAMAGGLAALIPLPDEVKGRKRAHWIGCLWCFVPVIWFCISWSGGYVHVTEWFMTIRE